jgi:polyadenylate-binding protein
LVINSIEDESALRAKVDEALTVYDEYVKTKGGDGEPSGEAEAKESKEDEKTEEKA